jgi:hypothetical protein
MHRSQNRDAQWPGDPNLLFQIAGFQYYDTAVKTIVSNVRFQVCNQSELLKNKPLFM